MWVNIRLNKKCNFIIAISILWLSSNQAFKSISSLVTKYSSLLVYNVPRGWTLHTNDRLRFFGIIS